MPAPVDNRYKDLPAYAVEHLDYKYVEKCEDADELRDLLKVLESGKEGFYPRLNKFTEDRLVAGEWDRVLRDAAACTSLSHAPPRARHSRRHLLHARSLFPCRRTTVYKQLGIAIVAGYVLARWQSSLPENAASTSL